MAARARLGGFGDPVEGGVGEGGVELGFVGEGFGGVVGDVQAAGAGGGDHGGGGVGCR